MPFDPDDPTALVVDAFADFGTPAPGRLVGGGAAESRGLEGMVQKKLARRLYGTASYAWARSRYTDLSGRERDRSFDNRHLVSLIVGYRQGETREYSLRWRFAGGRPYTPFDEEASAREGTGIVQRGRVNELRLPPYHRLDLRVDHRRHFGRFQPGVVLHPSQRLQPRQPLPLFLGHRGQPAEPHQPVEPDSGRRIRARVLRACGACRTKGIFRADSLHARVR